MVGEGGPVSSKQAGNASRGNFTGTPDVAVMEDVDVYDLVALAEDDGVEGLVWLVTTAAPTQASSTEKNRAMI